jgi:glycosyltransferase involved in cell wall biosynthesis
VIPIDVLEKRSVGGSRSRPTAASGHTLSIVIPALNEEGNLGPTLEAVTKVAARYFDDYEVIVVNDGSTDGTLAVAEKAQRENSRIRITSHATPLGFGASYQAGRRLARMTYTIMVHGDNAFGIETLDRVFSAVGRADVICGFIANPTSRTKARQLISSLYTLCLNAIFGYRLKYFNGLQVHRTAWLREVELVSSGFGFQAELLIHALRNGMSYEEVPTLHQERPGGGVTKIFRLKNLVSVARTVLHLLLACSPGKKGSPRRPR